MFKENVVYVIRLILGIIFLVLGIIGLFLPILQGILFIFIGLALLGSHWAQKKVKKIITWVKGRR